MHFRFHGKLGDYKLNEPMAVTDSIKLDYNCAWEVGLKRFNKFMGYCGEIGDLLMEHGY